MINPRNINDSILMIYSLYYLLLTSKTKIAERGLCPLKSQLSDCDCFQVFFTNDSAVESSSMPAVLSKVADELVIELDENGLPIYNPIEVHCKFKGKNRVMWQVEEHTIAVEFLKLHVPVCL